MTKNYFTGAAPATRDVYKLVIAVSGGVWVAADTITITVGVRALVVTLGALITVDKVALAIQQAFMAGQRLDGTDPAHLASSNFGGQELGEFSEITATFDGTATVWFRANDAGRPVSLAVSKSSTHGTATLTHPQVATGPKFYSNTQNWSLAALPGNTDEMILQGGGKSIEYGLPTGGTLPTVTHYADWDGQIGRPPINRDNANKPYPEYRATLATFDDSTIGMADGNRTHSFGLGPGPGSAMLNLQFVHNIDGCSNVNVYRTSSSPLIPDGRCLNLVLANSVSGSPGEVCVLRGSVALQGVVGVINGGESDEVDILIQDLTGIDLVVTAQGGRVQLLNTIEGNSNDYTVNAIGGKLTITDVKTSGNIDMEADDGTIIYNTTGDFTSLIVAGDGVFDAEQDTAGRTFSGDSIELYQGASLLDGYGRGTYTNGPDLVRCDVFDLKAFRIGQNKRLTIGAIP